MLFEPFFEQKVMAASQINNTHTQKKATTHTNMCIHNVIFIHTNYAQTHSSDTQNNIETHVMTLK